MWQGTKSFVLGFLRLNWINVLVLEAIMAAGNVSKSIFILGTLWVTSLAVAYPLLSWLLGANSIGTINQLCLLCFSWLPELILPNAIVHVFYLWYKFIVARKAFDIAWAIAYTLPTILFVFITVTTIYAFISQKDISQVVSVRLDGVQLAVRVFTGWVYGMLTMVSVKLGSGHVDVGMVHDAMGTKRSSGQGRSVKKQAMVKNAPVQQGTVTVVSTNGQGTIQVSNGQGTVLDKKTILLEMLSKGQSVTGASKALGINRKTAAKWVREQKETDELGSEPSNVVPLHGHDEKAL